MGGGGHSRLWKYFPAEFEVFYERYTNSLSVMKKKFRKHGNILFFYFEVIIKTTWRFPSCSFNRYEAKSAVKTMIISLWTCPFMLFKAVFTLFSRQWQWNFLQLSLWKAVLALSLPEHWTFWKRWINLAKIASVPPGLSFIFLRWRFIFAKEKRKQFGTRTSSGDKPPRLVFCACVFPFCSSGFQKWHPTGVYVTRCSSDIQGTSRNDA